MDAWGLVLEMVALRMASRMPPPPPQIPPHYHILTRLPPAFWSRMHLYLDYADILRLSQLSSEFRAVQLHTYLPWRVRHAVVAACELEASAADHGDGQAMQFACYLCFQMMDVGAFPAPNNTASHARVLQREPYTGRRLLEPVSRPSEDPLHSTEHTPSPSVLSPAPSAAWTVGGGVADEREVAAGDPRGLQAAATAAMAAASGSGSRTVAVEALWRRREQTLRLMAASAGQRLPLQAPASFGVPGYGPASYPTTTMPAFPTWWPQAPGAEVGQIESLRRYCVGCALAAQLLVPGDVFTTRTGAAFWVCQCRHAQRRQDASRCPVCRMHPVYID